MTDINYPEFSVLLVDDEISFLRSLSIMLERQGSITNIIKCDDSRNVMDILAKNNVGLVLLDITMPHLSGIEILEMITENYPNIAVIMISGLNQVDSAVTCLKMGAQDYYIKTTEENRLIEGIKRTIHMQEMRKENSSLSHYMLNNTLQKPDVFNNIITQSQSILSIFQYMESIADSTSPVLFTGENGTGKNLFAETFHLLTNSEGPIITLNIAGLNDETFAKELFGPVTRIPNTDSALDAAAGGTLILDGIADLSIVSQVKLLRLIEKNEFHPAKYPEAKKLRSRLILLSGRNLEKRCDEGLFRKDLYFKLGRHHIKLPALRDRPYDITPLLNHFLEKSASEQGKKSPNYPPELPLLLSSYQFPGNVRELKALVNKAISNHRSRLLSMEAFREAIKPDNNNAALNSNSESVKFNADSALPSLSMVDDILVKEAMRRAKGNQSLAARMLGISQPALSKRLKKMTE